MAGRPFMGIPRERIPWAPKIDPDRCVGCGDCLNTCPNGVFVLDGSSGKAELAEPDNCVVLCDKCAAFCPAEAISFPDKKQIKQLLSGLLKETKTG